MSALEYRGKVRERDPEASWEAAARQTTQKVELIRSTICTLLGTHGPMTDEQLVDRFEAYAWLNPSVPNVTPQSIRTRRKALNVEGLVRDTGNRGRTRTGNTATIWAVADE